MAGVLVIAEHLRGQLRDVTAEVVAAARTLGAQGLGSVTVAVVAPEPGPLAAACAFEGVDEVVELALGGAGFDADAWTDAIVALVGERRPAAVLASFSVDSMGFGAAVAARLGAGFASDVTALAVEAGAIVATRELYQSKVEADLEFPQKETVVLLLRPATWTAAAAGGSPQRSTATAPN